MDPISDVARGIVGIFDVLGTKDLDADSIPPFIVSRDEVISEVNKVAQERSTKRGTASPSFFSFNDTLVIALDGHPDEYNAIKTFSWIVRRFITHSLTKTLFFRGAFSIGDYIADSNRNLILGNAVSDAAKWYEQAQFVGAIATPKASLRIRSHILPDPKKPDFLLFETDIPCKGNRVEKLYTVNWPKAFFVENERPDSCVPGEELSCLMRLLSANEIPPGTELKYKNTVDFFEMAPRD